VAKSPGKASTPRKISAEANSNVSNPSATRCEINLNIGDVPP
jgi:hypothetical protein